MPGKKLFDSFWKQRNVSYKKPLISIYKKKGNRSSYDNFLRSLVYILKDMVKIYAILQTQHN